MVDLASVIRPGDAIIWGQACAEPQTLVEALVAQRAHLGGVGCFLGSSYSGIVKPEHADHLRLSSYCGIGTNRALADAGALAILPAPYSQLAGLIRARAIPVDILMVQVSRPNARGEYSLGLAADYLVPALDTCRAIVAEVNAQVPWTHSERLLAKDDLDLVVETNRPPASPPARRRGSSSSRSRATRLHSSPMGRYSSSASAPSPTRSAARSAAMKACACIRAASATAWSNSPSAGS
jgi:acetyl-CoA hydrolase